MSVVFGSIKGVSIGQIFTRRRDLSDAWVHAPLQAGIWGGANEGACSIVLSVADTTDKLMDLQKKIKDVNEDAPKTNNVTNNALFVGSTSELSKMLKKGFLNNKEEK